MNNETGKEHDAKPLLSVVKFRTVNLSMININNPDFKNAAKVHDWRNYVPCDWQKNWEQFTERERQIIAVMAQSQADKEEWD
jgi:hypothetical protein